MPVNSFIKQGQEFKGNLDCIYQQASLSHVFHQLTNLLTVSSVQYQPYAVGDSVFVQSSEKLPFIGRLTTIRPGKAHGGHQLKIYWFYRPDDQAIEGGRKVYHGKQELFESDHSDLIHSDTVMGLCYVHSYEDYLNLDTLTSIDYYCRWKYMVKTKKFSPEKVNVYCSCKLPENPDIWMVHCNACGEWYHPRCINKTMEELDGMEEYICDDCQRPMHR